MATFGIIYASGSKMIRRIISGSTNLTVHIGPGESLLTVQQENVPNVFEAETAVEAATGVRPASISCAIIDDAGAIKSIIKADPAIDGVDKHTLIPTYPGVTDNCTYDAKTGLFVAPIVIIQAGTITKDGGVIAEAIVIGGPIAKPIDLSLTSP